MRASASASGSRPPREESPTDGSTSRVPATGPAREMMRAMFRRSPAAAACCPVSIRSQAAGCRASSAPRTSDGWPPRCPMAFAIPVSPSCSRGSTTGPSSRATVSSRSSAATARSPRCARTSDGRRSEVLLESYILKDDTTGRGFLEALAAARSRGVTVRVLADVFGSFATRASSGTRWAPRHRRPPLPPAVQSSGISRSAITARSSSSTGASPSPAA